MMFPYEDIVHLPHPVSARHARMSDADRAAQFSPFAALNGHGDAIRETARLTDSRIELDENEKALLNGKLQALARRLPHRPTISVTHFVPDHLKSGGAYVTTTGQLKNIDETEQRLVLTSGLTLCLDDVCALEELRLH